MEHHNQDDLLYALGLALLELLDQPINLEIARPGKPDGLILDGILLRAFDPPTQTNSPSITAMVGGQCIAIRPSTIHNAQIHRTPDPANKLTSISLSLSDGYTIQIQPKPPAKRPQPQH